MKVQISVSGAPLELLGTLALYQNGGSGATGPMGAPGTTGPMGAPGTTGPMGATGASPWTINGPNAYYNGGYIGIGTATPTQALHVNGTAKVLGLQLSGTQTIHDIYTCTQNTITGNGTTGTVACNVTSNWSCTCQFTAQPTPSTAAVSYAYAQTGAVYVGFTASLASNTAPVRCNCVLF